MNHTIKYIKGIFWLLSGVIIVAVLDIITPSKSTKWKYLDNIYGNRIDSIDGDAAYQAKVKILRRYRWCQLRNPVNNYARSVGPNGNIHSVDTIGDKIFGMNRIVRTVELSDGSIYKLYQIRVFSKLYLLWGHMLLEDWREGVDSKFDSGHHYETRMILSPFKFKSLPLGGA